MSDRMDVIAREVTEDEWRMIEAQRAAQVIVGGEPGSTYPWVKLAQEVVRLRSQLAGAVAAIRKAPHARHCEAGSQIWPGPCTCWKREWLDPSTTGGGN